MLKVSVLVLGRETVQIFTLIQANVSKFIHCTYKMENLQSCSKTKLIKLGYFKVNRTECEQNKPVTYRPSS